MQEKERVDLLKEKIQKYIKYRREYVQKIRDRQSVGFTSEYMNLMGSVHDIGSDAYLVIEDIKAMLLDDDIEISWTARVLIQNMGESAASLIPEMFQVMEKWGVNEYPFKIGEILVSLSDNHPQVIDLLKKNINSKSDKLVQAVIHTFSLLGNRSEVVYEDLMKLAIKGSDETKGFAISTLGETGKQDDSLCNLLLDSAIHTEWYIRGYAIGSMGKLKLSPQKCLPIIINALTDDEGHDWTVRESAITALGEYGQNAMVAVPYLQELRIKLKAEDDDSSYAVRQLNQALGKIKGIFPN
jgi:HEAT repeats